MKDDQEELEEEIEEPFGKIGFQIMLISGAIGMVVPIWTGFSKEAISNPIIILASIIYLSANFVFLFEIIRDMIRYKMDLRSMGGGFWLATLAVEVPAIICLSNIIRVLM